MNEQNLRKELYAFYLHGDAERSESFADKCFKIMDSRYYDEMSVTKQKILQYDVIVDEFEPIIFRFAPFFYETGVLTSLSDGACFAKGHSFIQANGWVYQKNEHLFADRNEQLWKKKNAQAEEQLYLICGPYNDVFQHFNFNFRVFLQIGLKGVYEKAEKQLSLAKNDEETEFLQAVCHGCKSLRRMAMKFSEKAKNLSEQETDEECKKNLKTIAETARRVPWEPPETFYEGLATLAFLRTAVGTLEGVGPNTFGRLDKDLIDLYRSDIENGNTTPESAYDLICMFLLIWDCHYDHDMLMAGYADHELENTYVLGGCDDNGNPLCNELTMMFLRATKEKNIIFPKIKCRFSKCSPREYLDEISSAITQGKSMVLLQNDDSTIPALVRSGKTLKEAYDYLVTGCWGVATYQEKYDHGSYLNLLKSFEWPLHNLTVKMKKTGVWFKCFDECKSFSEFYKTVLQNCETLIDERLNITKQGGRIFHKVNRFPIFSSTLGDCLEKRKDFTMGGAKYRDDYLLMFGFPNLIDSMLAVKTLVFDQKKYTLQTLLDAVRSDWEGYDEMRFEAMHCPGWGDGSDMSCQLANQFNNDLFAICQRKIGTYGGKVNMGHLTYTEILWWGKQTRALPDGRKNGEYFAQGLTPSRLKKIPYVTDVINSLRCLDPSTTAANSVINIILPGNCSVDRCSGFIRAAADTAMQSLQLNCVSKETLLDAQNHPEQYPDLIVRVTGFSVKFTALSKEWQDEFISRNFYR